MTQTQKSQAAANMTLVSADVYYELVQFYNMEARLLDGFNYPEWNKMLADDIHYYQPVRAVTYDNQMREGYNAGYGGYVFDEDKERMEIRFKKFETELGVSDNPRPLMRHMVSNITATVSEDGNEYEVVSYFMVQRFRHNRYQDFYTGQRTDKLRRASNEYGWEIYDREILLDQTQFIGGTTSFFF
ncbi:MAG: hypothetical protein CMF31_00195 [Kordiimonas sp.]|nr:hypothetical protein [Kordiimonas sp.]